MDNSLITILIANYNSEQFFKDCFNSLILQTVSNFEVIILDDCSNDNSISNIENLILNDYRFKLYKLNQNQGVGFVKNKLIDLASSEICAFLDPDDALLPNALEVMIEAHNKYINAGLIYSNYFECDYNLNIKRIHYNKQVEFGNSHFCNLHGEISHFCTFKKSIYNLTSGINPILKLAEDQDLYLKLFEISDAVYLNCNLYLYRIHKLGISQNKSKNKALYWHWYVLFKMSERRNINLEDDFLNYFIPRFYFDRLRKHFFIRLLYKIKIIKESE